MTEREFNLIVKKAVHLGNAYKREIDKLDEWCQKKYKCNWSDLDCDDIIDSLQCRQHEGCE